MTANILHSSESNGWYTPALYTDLARQVMGSIDLDPASCEIANQTVQATHFYTKEQDGLQFNWFGNVFLNPPYGRTNGKSNQEIWTRKLLTEYLTGRMLLADSLAVHVEQAILLVNATPSNKWFQPLWNFPICFTDHRISFWNEKGERSSPTHSNCFVYFGDDEDKFEEVFSEVGTVVYKMGLNKRESLVKELGL